LPYRSGYPADRLACHHTAQDPHLVPAFIFAFLPGPLRHWVRSTEGDPGRGEAWLLADQWAVMKLMLASGWRRSLW
jgi:hypothetical protein